MALNYKRARKKEKGKILNTVIDLAGYNCSYAARVLRERATPKVIGRVREGGRTITLVEDERTKKQRKRPRKYDKEVVVVLLKV